MINSGLKGIAVDESYAQILRSLIACLTMCFMGQTD